MKNRRNIIFSIIILILIIIGFSIYWYLKGYMPKYRWYEKLTYDNEEPYGLKLVYDILSDTNGKYDFTVVKKDLKANIDTTDTSSLYMFIGRNIIINSENTQALIDFAKKGNVIFISTVSGEHNFYDVVTEGNYPRITFSDYYDSIVDIKFLNVESDSLFRFNFKYNKSLQAYNWYGIDSITFADTLQSYGFEAISSINEGIVDCYSVKIGKGLLIHHTNPILFTNYYLRQEQGLTYLNQLFPSQPFSKIYWDELSKNRQQDAQDELGGESVFRFIFSQKSLKWSWFLLLGFGFLFILLNAKRRLPAIPLVPENRNSTVEYIHTIAFLQYQNNTILFMADEMMKQFFTFVKHKYNISQNADSFLYVKQIAPRSGIPAQKIEEVFKCYREIKYNEIPEKQSLIGLYNTIEYFYNNCK